MASNTHTVVHAPNWFSLDWDFPGKKNILLMVLIQKLELKQPITRKIEKQNNHAKPIYSDFSIDRNKSDSAKEKCFYCQIHCKKLLVRF